MILKKDKNLAFIVIYNNNALSVHIEKTSINNLESRVEIGERNR